MNIAFRKLALLEKNILQQEEVARTQGYSTNVIDADLKKRVMDLMDKIRIV